MTGHDYYWPIIVWSCMGPCVCVCRTTHQWEIIMGKTRDFWYTQHSDYLSMDGGLLCRQTRLI